MDPRPAAMAPTGLATSGLLARVLDLRSGEHRLVAALFALSFVIGLGLVTVEVAVEASLLAVVPASMLPWALVAVAAAVLLGGAALPPLRARLSPAAFIGGPLAVLAGLALIVVLWFVGDAPGLAVLLVVHAGQRVLAAFAIVGFWTLAARALDSEQSRRLYGLVSAGELLGVLVVGLSAASLQRALELRSQLVLALALLALAGLAMLPLARSVQAASPALVPAADRAPASPAERRHITRCIGLYAAYNVTYDLIEFAVFVAIQRAHPGQPDAIAGTLGALVIVRLVVGALVRVFLTGRLLARVGLGVGLASTPALVLAIASLSFIFMPAAGSLLTAAVVLSTGEAIVRNALGRPAFMVAQRPLSPAPRERTLITIETVVEPVSTGITGTLLLLLSPAMWFSGPLLLVLPIPSALAWLVFAGALSRSYRRLDPEESDRTHAPD